jgi:hypothetical protein
MLDQAPAASAHLTELRSVPHSIEMIHLNRILLLRRLSPIAMRQ